MNHEQMNTVWGDSHTDFRQHWNIQPSIQQRM